MNDNYNRTVDEAELETLSKEREKSGKRHPVSIVMRALAYALCISATITATVNVAEGGAADTRLFSPVIAIALLLLIWGVEKFGRLRVPVYLDTALCLFICGALPLGSTYGFYGSVPGWDKLLHTLSGFVFYFVGLCIGDLVAGKAEGKRRVIIATLIALTVSLSVGYLWELFEFAGDSLFGMNNQRWQNGLLEELADGTYIVSDPRGTALIDTMSDMIFAFAGTLTCFIPTLIAFLLKPSRIDGAVMKKL